MKNVSEETRRRMSESAKARCTPEWRKARSDMLSSDVNADDVRRLYDSGLTQQEVAEQLGVSQKVVYGCMRRNSITARVAKKREQNGPSNDSWRGPDATYAAFHLRVRAARGAPSKCEHCGTTSAKRFEWASISKNYEDVNDYVRLCASCHHKFDGTVANLGKYAVKCA